MYEERLETIGDLQTLAGRFNSAFEFVEYADLQLEAYRKNEGKSDMVTFSTVHKAKGLEYPTVFIASCIDGIFPHKNATDYEEERRIMYVAMTRAVNNLEFSAINERNGEHAYISPFIKSIVTHLNIINTPAVRL